MESKTIEEAMKQPFDEDAAWRDLITWLKWKFGDFEEYQVEDKQFIELSRAFDHEQDCKVCTDITECHHSMARLIPYQTQVNGFTVVKVAAECCQGVKEVKETKNKTDMLEASMIPRNRRRNSFTNFETTGMSVQLMAAKGLALECAENGRGLLIGGNVGCGKTHLALAVALHGIEHGKSALFYSLPELLDKIRKEVINGSTDLLDRAKVVDILVIDDCGTQRFKDFGDETIFKIVDARYNNKLQTIITTNAVGMQQFKSMLKGKEGESDRSERICSRIIEMTEQIWLPNEGDYRKVKKEEGD
jgi:DNA replication protein DnaC